MSGVIPLLSLCEFVVCMEQLYHHPLVCVMTVKLCLCKGGQDPPLHGQEGEVSHQVGVRRSVLWYSHFTINNIVQCIVRDGPRRANNLTSIKTDTL
jgi:hypothetical protein